MENKPVWSHPQFVKFFKKSPRKAYEYRKEALWCEIPGEYLTEDEKNSIKWLISNETEISEVNVVEEEKTAEKVEEIEEETQEEQTEFTRDDLIKKLTEAGIKVHPATKDETLLKKAIENNLI